MVLLPIHFLREVTGFPVTKTFLLAIAALSNQLEDAFLFFFKARRFLKYHCWFLCLQLLFTAVKFWVFIEEATTKHQPLLWVGLFKRQVVFCNTSKQPPSLGAPQTLVKLLLHEQGEMINRNQFRILVQPGSVRASKDVSQDCSSLCRV